jgi:type IV fimbrial biogenesis protein FimT
MNIQYPSKDQCSGSNKKLGYSLIEVCITLGILFSLLVFVPCFKAILIHQEQTLILDKINYAITYARSEAFLRRKTISLCPSINRTSCSLTADWSTGFIIFENPGSTKQPNVHSILEVFEGAQHGYVYFSATGNQLHIHPNGTTTNIGTFLYSPKQSSHLKPKGLVVNWATRTYMLNESTEL